MSYQKSGLSIPLPARLIEFIKYTYPDQYEMLISTIEISIKKENNQYEDLLASISPLLNENTPAFLNKLFMFNKKNCKSDINCTNKHCLFLHPISWEEKFATPEGRNDSVKKVKFNKEIVYNKVNEKKFNMDEIKKFASQFGEVEFLRKLNNGKFLVVFSDSESAVRAIESAIPVLGDASIKKFFNIMPSNYLSINKTKSLNKNAESVKILKLLDEQDMCLKKIENTHAIDISDLKLVTLQIKNYINNNCLKFNDENKDKELKFENSSSKSIYSDLFK